ncbi:MAG: TetR/AcrR family transcriptional regulator [Leptospira sp.]|nr:TetR/AcrR family transcriptional regulator [Leptospira sp.]NCS94719.1 TetR/AcrR family transcriptional regulator [Leptospira sp.]
MSRTKEFEPNIVLDKAMHLFWYRGYNATSMQELVNHLGISRSSLYESFGDKKELYVNCLRKYRNEYTEQMLQKLQNTESLPLTLEKILKYIIEDSLHAKQQLGCFMINATLEFGGEEKEIAKIIEENNNSMLSTLITSIQNAQLKKQINTRYSAEALSHFFMNAISGLRILGSTCKDEKTLEESAKITLEVFKS